TGLQGERWVGGISERCAGSMPARHSDDESARYGVAQDLRDGREVAARSRADPLAVLAPIVHQVLRVPFSRIQLLGNFARQVLRPGVSLRFWTRLLRRGRWERRCWQY